MPKPKVKWRIVLVDDNSILLGAMKRVLDEEADFEVVGVAMTPEKGLATIAEHNPDVAVIDYIFNGEKMGLRLATDIKSAHPQVNVIMLTAWNIKQAEARAAGCDGLIDKADLLRNITWVIRALKK